MKRTWGKPTCVFLNSVRSCPAVLGFWSLGLLRLESYDRDPERRNDVDGITWLIGSQNKTWIWTYRRQKSIKPLLCTYCMPGTSGVPPHIPSTLIHTTKLRSWQRRKLKLRKLNRLLKTHRLKDRACSPGLGDSTVHLIPPGGSFYQATLSSLDHLFWCLALWRIRFNCCPQSKRETKWKICLSIFLCDWRMMEEEKC